MTRRWSTPFDGETPIKSVMHYGPLRLDYFLQNFCAVSGRGLHVLDPIGQHKPGRKTPIAGISTECGWSDDSDSSHPKSDTQSTWRDH